METIAQNNSLLQDFVKELENIPIQFTDTLINTEERNISLI
jgi:hypothetical protein